MKRSVGLFLVFTLVFALILGGTGCVSRTPNTTPPPTAVEIPYKDLVENFIKTDATYVFDGIEGSLIFLKTVSTVYVNDPGSIQEWEYTVEYQTRHPGEGDRTGQVLAQEITTHNVVVKVKDGQIVSAVCDADWDMVNDRNLRLPVTGTVIGGGDTTIPGGPLDVPRVFVYEVKTNDGTTVKVSYNAYPPSPVGDAYRSKVTLEFAGGSIAVGDRIEALGRFDAETNTIQIAEQGDYIKTFSAQLPVISEEVSWNIGETVVAATITRPDDNGVHPAVVLVPGSGPTDRDWNSPLLPGTNGSARLLAEELAGSGFVTIRYDKRFTGPNAQKNRPLLIGNISMEGHVVELAGAVDRLLSRADVDPQKIFAVANSEGNIHAMNYQMEREPKLAGLVLIAPPGRNMPDIIHTQIEAQVASLPNAEEIMDAFDKGLAAFLAGEPYVADPVLPEGIGALIQSLYNPVNLPFTRELFLVDGSKLLSQVTVPALVVIGKKDIQVDWQFDGAPLEAVAVAMSNVEFVYPENANHVLKNEPRPRSALTAADGLTYNAADKILDPEGLQVVKDWLAVQIAGD
jgi:pimeloyl-ACP methyl ester carboxylesterase